MVKMDAESKHDIKQNKSYSKFFLDIWTQVPNVYLYMTIYQNS